MVCQAVSVNLGSDIEMSSRASPFRILIYSSGIRKMTVPLGDRKINSKNDKVVAVIRKYPLII